MEVSPDIQDASFRHGLRQGMVFWMRGEPPFESKDYHIFIVLNRDPKPGEVLFLVNGTSQVLKTQNRLHWLLDGDQDLINATSVAMKAGSYQFITKDTMIDCNMVHCVKIGLNDFKMRRIIVAGEYLNDNDLNNILSAVNMSRQVPEHIKRAIDKEKGGNI